MLIHALLKPVPVTPLASAWFKISRPESATQTIFLPEKNLRGETIDDCF